MSVLWIVALAAASPSKEASKAADEPIKKVVVASAGAIDGCVGRYLYEKPKATGTAEVSAVFAKTGEVRTARVTTRLLEPRNLIVCLRRVARAWKLPPLVRDNARLDLTVAVYPGARFSLEPRKPEAPTAGSEPAERPLGSFTYQPGGFWNSGWRASQGSEAPEGDTGMPREDASEDEGPELTGEAPESGPGIGVPE